MMRQSLLYLSRRKSLRRWMETSRWVEGLTRRFVAGSTLDEALTVCRQLYGEKLLATVDQLGENVTTTADANHFRGGLEEAYDAIADARLPLTISIKLTQLGLDLSTDLCTANTEILATKAAARGSRLEIDMEDSSYVDRTLEIARKMHERCGHVRCVLQSYLYRTEHDLKEMNELGVPVRLCKGAYSEPPSEAFPAKREVDENYLKLTRMLMSDGNYPAIATHDPRMIDGALEAATRYGRTAEEFEFQMLFGVRRDLQTRLAAQGYRVRLYVPFGDAWYPYFMRRLAERPANVVFLARNLLRA
jgi:proline dehydrogenase